MAHPRGRRAGADVPTPATPDLLRLLRPPDRLGGNAVPGVRVPPGPAAGRPVGGQGTDTVVQAVTVDPGHADLDNRRAA